MAAETNKILVRLCGEIKKRSYHAPMAFADFLGIIAQNPLVIFRDIFQLFHDMVHHYVGEGVDEYPDDPESIKFVRYDCEALFINGSDNPFFADRLFANRSINHINGFRRGIQQNKIHVFKGPHGCGKSTFLNNLLSKFEEYAKTEEGASYEVLWRIDRSRFGGTENSDNILEVPCPSHDHPWLLVPKEHRRNLLEHLVEKKEWVAEILSEKRYEWVFRDQPCTICQSLYQALLEKLEKPDDVFSMVFARRRLFNRRLGQGISVFNPGDPFPKEYAITNEALQKNLDLLLNDSGRVNYVSSVFTATNNGIFALMDVKGHNERRFSNLHGIVSEGVHKLGAVEESVKSFFIVLANPEDRENGDDGSSSSNKKRNEAGAEGMIDGGLSFEDRIVDIKIPYVLDYKTEVKILLNAFGAQVAGQFMPHVMESFAKIIISTRLNPRLPALKEWIQSEYDFLDRNYLLVKMEIYAGLIPPWLDDDDRRNFTAKCRRQVIAESEFEGDKGFSGRDSLRLFNELLAAGGKKEDDLITISQVEKFFEKYCDEDDSRRKNDKGKKYDGRDGETRASRDFLGSVVSFYDYSILQEFKESLYFYNDAQVKADVLNYLFAVNYEPGQTVRCGYTGQEITVSEEFFETMEKRFFDPALDARTRKIFREDIQRKYALAIAEGRTLAETDIYLNLYKGYSDFLKDKVLDPFISNPNFRSAIMDFGGEAFKTYDKRIREEVALLMDNLRAKYGYSPEGAREICIYVIDNDLAYKYA